MLEVASGMEMSLVLMYGKFPGSFTFLSRGVFISHSLVNPCLGFTLECGKTCLKMSVH